MRTILVTGGAGFIGSAVCRHIITNTEDRVINLDKLTYAGNLNSLAAIASSPRYEFEQADICDRKTLDRIFAQYQPDAVMHLAAESHVDRSISGSAAFIETNIIGQSVWFPQIVNGCSIFQENTEKMIRLINNRMKV